MAPHLQIGGRPIRNSSVAVAARIRTAATAARIGRFITLRLTQRDAACKGLLLVRNQSSMLRAYGPNCDGSTIDPSKSQSIPDEATWIDLDEPTRAEDKLVEQCVGVQ